MRNRRSPVPVAGVRASGQALITTTDVGHGPGAAGPGFARVAVRDGAVLQEAAAA